LTGKNKNGSCRSIARGLKRVVSGEIKTFREGLAQIGTITKNCGRDPIGCLDDLKVALAPLVLAGLTVQAYSGLVATCFSPLAAATGGVSCVAGAIIFVPATIGGGYATYEVSRKVWFSKDRCKYYHALCGEHEEHTSDLLNRSSADEKDD
jgi:hypothetical protein